MTTTARQMTASEIEGYVRRAMYSRRHNLTVDEAIDELRQQNLIDAQQEEAVRFAILISNDGS